MSLASLTRASGGSSANTYRILKTLEVRRLSECAPDSQLWSLGPAAFHLGQRYIQPHALPERARGVLNALALDTGETAVLTTLTNEGALVVGEAIGNRNPCIRFPEGSLLQGFETANAKIMLAFQSKAVRRRSINSQAVSESEAIRELNSLKELEVQGHAGAVHAESQDSRGWINIACAITDTFGVTVAAIGLFVPDIRVDDVSKARFAQSCKQAAAVVSMSLGNLSGKRHEGRC